MFSSLQVVKSPTMTDFKIPVGLATSLQNSTKFNYPFLKPVLADSNQLEIHCWVFKPFTHVNRIAKKMLNSWKKNKSYWGIYLQKEKKITNHLNLKSDSFIQVLHDHCLITLGQNFTCIWNTIASVLEIILSIERFAHGGRPFPPSTVGL